LCTTVGLEALGGGARIGEGEGEVGGVGILLGKTTALQKTVRHVHHRRLLCYLQLVLQMRERNERDKKERRGGTRTGIGVTPLGCLIPLLLHDAPLHPT
jgi:hypothetical protein